MVQLGKAGKGAEEQKRPEHEYRSQFYRLHPELKAEQDDYFYERETYLEAKRVRQLFNVSYRQRLLTDLILQRPANVRAFILKQLKDHEEYRKLPNKEPPRIFDSTDFDLMFDTFDLAKEGSVSFDVLVNAMRNCSIPEPERLIQADFPELGAASKISRQKFTQVLLKTFDQEGFS